MRPYLQDGSLGRLMKVGAWLPTALAPLHCPAPRPAPRPPPAAQPRPYDLAPAPPHLTARALQLKRAIDLVKEKVFTLGQQASGACNAQPASVGASPAGVHQMRVGCEFARTPPRPCPSPPATCAAAGAEGGLDDCHLQPAHDVHGTQGILHSLRDGVGGHLGPSQAGHPLLKQGCIAQPEGWWGRSPFATSRTVGVAPCALVPARDQRIAMACQQQPGASMFHNPYCQPACTCLYVCRAAACLHVCWPVAMRIGWHRCTRLCMCPLGRPIPSPPYMLFSSYLAGMRGGCGMLLRICI
jgi:hypothetical protein